jgi:hypothetical protein
MGTSLLGANQSLTRNLWIILPLQDRNNELEFEPAGGFATDSTAIAHVVSKQSRLLYMNATEILNLCKGRFRITVEL